MHLWPIVRTSLPRSQPHRKFLSLWRPLRLAQPGRAHGRDRRRLGGLGTRTDTRGYRSGVGIAPPCIGRDGRRSCLRIPSRPGSWTAVSCPRAGSTPMASVVSGIGIRDAGTRDRRFPCCRIWMSTHTAPMGSVCAPPIRRRARRARHVRSSTKASPHGLKRWPSRRARR